MEKNSVILNRSIVFISVHSWNKIMKRHYLFQSFSHPINSFSVTSINGPPQLLITPHNFLSILMFSFFSLFSLPNDRNNNCFFFVVVPCMIWNTFTQNVFIQSLAHNNIHFIEIPSVKLLLAWQIDEIFRRFFFFLFRFFVNHKFRSFILKWNSSKKRNKKGEKMF